MTFHKYRQPASYTVLQLRPTINNCLTTGRGLLPQVLVRTPQHTCYYEKWRKYYVAWSWIPLYCLSATSRHSVCRKAISSRTMDERAHGFPMTPKLHVHNSSDAYSGSYAAPPQQQQYQYPPSGYPVQSSQGFQPTTTQPHVYTPSVGG